jgi:radical SAM protein with 4Fe4S-binding SPASM domain
MTLSNKFRRLLFSNNRFNLVGRHLFLKKREYFFNSKHRHGFEPLINHNPLRLRIETTNRCNLRCITCPLSKKSYTRKKVDMDINLYKRIIDEVKMFRPKPDIILYMGGEPLLNKNIFDFISYAKKAGLYVQFNTNATLLTNDASQKLLKSGIDHIEFSFDDLDPQKYEAMRVNSNYKKTLNNILTFLKMKKEGRFKSPEVVIAGLRLQDNRLSDKLIGFEPNPDFADLFKKYDIAAYEMWYAHSWASSRNTKHRPCRTVYRDFSILSDGSCVPCCYDLNGDVKLGNINDGSVKEIWNNEKYQRLRYMLNNVKHNEIPLCKGCLD